MNEPNPQIALEQGVAAVFRRLAAGELSASGRQPGSGWAMTLPSGKTVVRSDLQAEADPLIALGPDAVPHLLRWASHENLALRYVALHALEQITGEKPYVPYFAKDDVEGHRAQALQVWQNWYDARAA